MKRLFIALFPFATSFACSRSNSSIQHPDTAYYGGWKWVETDGYGISEEKTQPSAGSTVVLSLERNGVYTCLLNGRATSNGSFAINAVHNTDSVYNSSTQMYMLQTTTDSLLQFNRNLITIDNLSLPSGENVVLYNDTLELHSPLTPEGAVFYFFVRQ